jgi:SAM-dependent methyltransferase
MGSDTKNSIRNCVYALMNRLAPAFRGKDVLEVGAGVCRHNKRLVTRRGGRWVGLDSRGPRNRATRQERKEDDPPIWYQASVEAMPIPDNSFDVVIASQTMEHWGPAALDTGLSEIHRVLRTGGLLSVDVPIWMHGSDAFVLGDVDAIKRMFERDRWERSRWEEWRRDYAPLAPEVQKETRRAKRIREQCPGQVPSMWVLQFVGYKPGDNPNYPTATASPTTLSAASTRPV